MDKAYWEARWQENKTGWDIGYPSPAIVGYVKQCIDKEAAILIPGCGNAHEAFALQQEGFRNVTVLDISPTAIALVKESLRNEDALRIVEGDFFRHQGQYDVVLEQTFFCALEPSRRPDYARQAAALLKTNGLIAGVLFNRAFNEPGPPFGGNSSVYREAFCPLFIIKKLEPCYNSIPERSGSELFFIFEKKETNL